jgi:hypothetical protein
VSTTQKDEPPHDPGADEVKGQALIRRLAKAIGPALVREYAAGRQLHDYSKNIHLNVPKDVHDRNLKIKRRAWMVARAKSHKAIVDLKVAMGVQDL